VIGAAIAIEKSFRSRSSLPDLLIADGGVGVTVDCMDVIARIEAIFEKAW
jgi:hypothetical protein